MSPSSPRRAVSSACAMEPSDNASDADRFPCDDPDASGDSTRGRGRSVRDGEAPSFVESGACVRGPVDCVRGPDGSVRGADDSGRCPADSVRGVVPSPRPADCVVPEASVRGVLEDCVPVDEDASPRTVDCAGEDVASPRAAPGVCEFGVDDEADDVEVDELAVFAEGVLTSAGITSGGSASDRAGASDCQRSRRSGEGSSSSEAPAPSRSGTNGCHRSPRSGGGPSSNDGPSPARSGANGRQRSPRSGDGSSSGGGVGPSSGPGRKGSLDVVAGRPVGGPPCGGVEDEPLCGEGVDGPACPAVACAVPVRPVAGAPCCEPPAEDCCCGPLEVV